MTVSLARNRQPAKSPRRGAAAVEFAIVLPLLVFLLLGGADFGRCFYSAIAIANAARAGAEYGAVNPFDSSTQTAWQSAVQQAAIDELSQSPLFDTSKLIVTATSSTESDGAHRVQVQATYPFKTIFTWFYIPASLTLQSSVVMRTIR